MKLFLSSLAVSPAQRPAFVNLLGKPAKQATLCLIENAADVEGQEPEWLLENRRALTATGMHIERLDLRTVSGAKLSATLEAADAIWLGGGNTYYLRWLLGKTGADTIIKRLVRQGTVYGGGSAGALIAGPTLAGFEEADDPADAPELVLDGLGFVDFVPVPHWDDPSYRAIMRRTAKQVEHAGYRAQPITQAQALVIVDGRLSTVE